MHGASTTGRNTAAELGAGHLEVLPQDPQERRVAVDRHLLALTIDRECSHRRIPRVRSLPFAQIAHLERSHRTPRGQPSKLILQKSEQPRRQEAGMTARLVDWIA